MPFGHRLWIIGFEGISAPILERMAREAPMPNMKRLLEQGAWSRCLPSIPVTAGSNWATMTTGAPIGVHGTPNPFMESTPTERFWDPAQRWGKQSLFINCGHLFPGLPRDSISLETDYTPMPHAEDSYSEFFPGSLVEMGEKTRTCSVLPVFKPAEPWLEMEQGIDPEASILQTRLEINSDRYFGLVMGLWLGISRNTDGAFDSLWIANNPDDEKLTKLYAGQWSEPLYAGVEIEGKKLTGVFRVLLEELDPDGKYMRAYVTAIRDTRSFVTPGNLRDDLTKQAGPQPPAPPDLEDIELDTASVLDMWNHHFEWLARAAVVLMQRGKCSLMFSRLAEPGLVNHYLLGRITPASGFFMPDDLEFWQARMRGFYAALDQFVGGILQAAGDADTVSFVSSNGNRCFKHYFSLRNFLIQQGFLKSVIENDQVKVVPEDSLVRHWGWEIWINGAERFGGGLVSPGEFEEHRDRIIQSLRSLRDPATGRSPVALALKREDAQCLGFFGPGRGDIIALLDPEYSFDGDRMNTEVFAPAGSGPLQAGHESWLPGVDDALGANDAFIGFYGRGIRKGYARDSMASGPVKMEDSAPTWAKILGAPQPRHSQGRTLDEFFE